MNIFSKFFRKGYNRIRVEGLKLNKFLSDSLKNNFQLTRIKRIDEFTLECNILQEDYSRLMAQNNSLYRITILKSKGIPQCKRQIFKNKGFSIGFLLFIFLLYYQSLFITEINIKGIEYMDENHLLNSLSKIGVEEGYKKTQSTDEIKSYLYGEYEDISWLGVSYTGNRLNIEIVEKVKAPEIIPMDIPCDIVADKQGYIHNVVAKYGTKVVEEGTFVKKGDLLISGTVTKLNQQANNEENMSEVKYVHSLGEVYAKIVYRFIILEEKIEYIKKDTGKKDYGFNLKVGDVRLDAGKLFLDFNRYKSKNTELFQTMVPMPIALYCTEYSEIEIKTRTKSQKEIENNINTQVESFIKKNIPTDAKIANKDLMFSELGNIIKVEVMIEAIEEIGTEHRIKNMVE